MSGAGNQQERLIQLGWVIGFVDGEGCFSIGFVRQPHRMSRKGYKIGWQMVHRFVVSQGSSSRACLEDLKRFFGVGRVYANPRHDNHREHMAQFVVNRRVDLVETIVPFCEKHPLRSAKRMDFEKFARCVSLAEEGAHLVREGLVEILEIAETMNHRKSRRELVRILRGHTPEVQDTGS